MRSSALCLLAVFACGGSEKPEPPLTIVTGPVTPDLVAPRGEQENQFTQRQALPVNKWLEASRIRSGFRATLEQVMGESKDQSGKLRRLSTSQVTDALEGWLKGARGLDSARQAAAYLIADRVLRVAWRPFIFADPEQPDVRNRLNKVGAVTEKATSGEPEYSGGWLQAAIALDPAGPWGQRASLLQLEGDCAGGDSPDDYHSILQRLQAVVASPADPDVKTVAQIMEADAYRDRVALGAGFGKENADSAKFAPEAASARNAAVALYQSALASDSMSRLSKGARITLNRLIGGLTPDHVRFFCLGT